MLAKTEGLLDAVLYKGNCTLGYRRLSRGILGFAEPRAGGRNCRGWLGGRQRSPSGAAGDLELVARMFVFNLLGGERG